MSNISTAFKPEPICVQCGNNFQAVDDGDYCVNCKVSAFINNYYKEKK